MESDFWYGLIGGFLATFILVFAARTFFFAASPTPTAPAQPTVSRPTAPAKPAPKPAVATLRLLSILQREGRLVDFLLEDVSGYSDQQIGASVRDIHQKCQKALRESLDLEPIINQAEDSTVEVPSGFDPASVRVTGNVVGEPPFKGTLIHRGWRVTKVKVAESSGGKDDLVVQPAEVEL